MRVVADWMLETNDLYSAVVTRGRQRHYLLVERLPTAGWDWVIWSDDLEQPAIYGKSAETVFAMRAAEAAVGKRLAFDEKISYIWNVQSSGWAAAFP